MRGRHESELILLAAWLSGGKIVWRRLGRLAVNQLALADDNDIFSVSEYSLDGSESEKDFVEDTTPRASTLGRSPAISLRDHSRTFLTSPRKDFQTKFREPFNTPSHQPMSHYPIHRYASEESETNVTPKASRMVLSNNIRCDSKFPPGRTPVIQQSISSSPVVNRYSQHGGRLSPSQTRMSTYRDGQQVSSTGSRFRKDRLVSETYNLHERLERAEAQEREVFGLPPSSPTGGDRFPHADSVSSIGSERWKDNIGEFSKGAEAIFKALDNRGPESAPDPNRFSNTRPNMNSRLSHKPNENRSSYRYDSNNREQPIDNISSLVDRDNWR